MKASLQLKVGQQLTMTPQLQQAIRLLQLSTLDLQAEIQSQLESNPMLETTEDDAPAPADDAAGSDSNLDSDSSTEQEASSPETPEVADSVDTLESNNLPDELPVDSAWDDIYHYTGSVGLASPSDDDERDFESQNGTALSLYDHLMEQMRLIPMTEVDRAIALAIIDEINEEGYLNCSAEDILDTLDAGEEVELDEVHAVLRQIQSFDPPGVGARNLAECLALQLEQRVDSSLAHRDATILINQYIHLLGSRDYQQIQRKMKINEARLTDALKLVQTLAPRPGLQIADEPVEYVLPDVLVTKRKGRWVVELNPETAPKIRINSHYASLAKNVSSASDSSFMKDQLQEARWFLKSLLSRNDTLLKVAKRIVEHQIDFFEYGDEAMKPLVLHDIAEAVEMHESTISRVTTNKYMHTPRGIYELKYFFSSHVSTVTGGECSSTAIRAFIKKLIAAEERKKPLSDSKIATLLEEQGIHVARRTVAKYREAMSIPPSNERKRLF